MSTDPLWMEYTEAIRGVAALPDQLSSRLAETNRDGDAAVQRAQHQRDQRVHDCSEWAVQARRATANAEARLVAAKVLIPDAAAPAPAVDQQDPGLLVEELRNSVRDVDAALTTLGAARRRERDAAALAAAAAGRRQFWLRRVAVAAIVVTLLLILGTVFFG